MRQKEKSAKKKIKRPDDYVREFAKVIPKRNFYWIFMTSGKDMMFIPTTMEELETYRARQGRYPEATRWSYAPTANAKPVKAGAETFITKTEPERVKMR